MKSLLLLSAMALAMFAGACSSGIGGPPAPPPMGNFSASSLKGTYAFQMSGTDINGNFIARVGSFTADGTGNITAGIEDVNDGGTVNLSGSATPVVFDAAPQSTYTVLSNGRGTLTLHDASGALKFSITLSSSSAGLIVETDGNATASGSFRLQTITTTFSPAYAFDFSGLDLANQSGASFVGRFTTNTTTGITGGVFDENDGGSLTSSVSITPSTINLDPAFAATFGRGTLNIDGLNFAFYIVDGSNLAAVEEDSSVSFLTSGFATAQNAVPTQTSAIVGSFVFDVGGSATSNTFIGPLARAGRFDANGGAITNLFLDENFSASASTFPGTGGFSNVTLTIDPSGTGRGTLGFTDVTSGDVFSYVFYLSSASSGFIQDTSSAVVADGSLFLQSGTFTAASLAGNFIANWSGVNARNAFEEDFNAQFALSSATTNNIAGVVDYTELADNNNPVVTNAGVAGTFTLTGSGTGGGTMADTVSLQAGGQTFNFHAYLISNNSILLIGTDSNHVVLGTVSRQP
jgi:hypothetical protein